MLLDLSRNVVHCLVDECSKSVVVRTVGDDTRKDLGMLYHVDSTGEVKVTLSLKPLASVQRGSTTCYETVLPIHHVLPIRADRYQKKSKSKGATTEHFEVTSFRGNSASGRTLWRVELRVTLHNGRWLVGVYTPSSDGRLVETAAFSSKRLEPHAVVGETPLQRAAKVQETQQNGDIQIDWTPPHNAWGRLLDDDD